jgi:hypothetical protein
MQFLNGESINLILYISGIIALTFILIYTAFAGEDVEEDEDSTT